MVPYSTPTTQQPLYQQGRALSTQNVDKIMYKVRMLLGHKKKLNTYLKSHRIEKDSAKTSMNKALVNFESFLKEL